jgi:hypothetical protein
MAMWIRAFGDQFTEVEPTDGAAFTLPELQDFVGGYIEIVRGPHFTNGQTFIVLNEDGKGKGLPRNGFATYLYHLSGGSFDDWIVGDVLVCSRAELGEDDEPEE